MAGKTLQGRGFSAILVRSPRRQSLAIQVRRGEVIVRAPTALDEAKVLQFVQAKSAWIQKHLERQSRAPEPTPLRHGGTINFLGRSLRLVCRGAGRGPQVVLSDASLVLALPEAACESVVRACLARWLSDQAVIYLPRRVAEFAPRLKVAPTALKVRFYKSRWGSCNRRGELQFNWLIMMAPPDVVDYVVVHELCHLRHFDHSPAFWKAVASILPDYDRQRQWLKQQASLVW